MPLIDIKLNPTRTELRVFAALWALFFLMLGRMATWKPDALLIAACVTSTAWLVSLAFNKDFPRRVQLLGGLIPLTLAAIGTAERFGADPRLIEYTLWTIGGFGTLLALFIPSLAKSMYTGWMRAAVPLGWTFSHILLAAIYYLLFTPLGLLMRLRGHDPMQRRIDPAAASYWLARPPAPDPSRYFRQF
jgi:hypothetical protein